MMIINKETGAHTRQVELTEEQRDQIVKLIKERHEMVKAAIAIHGWADEPLETLQDEATKLEDLYLMFA